MRTSTLCRKASGLSVREVGVVLGQPRHSIMPHSKAAQGKRIGYLLKSYEGEQLLRRWRCIVRLALSLLQLKWHSNWTLDPDG
jgi:hypothetical protein